MKKVFRTSGIMLLGAAMAFTSCDLLEEAKESTSNTLSGYISENTVWKDLGLPVDYVIDGNLTIDGNAIVTVEAGVTIMFSGTNGGISVGENAGFKIEGTLENPVVFTGPANNLNKGSWNRISVSSKRADNVWEYATFLNGGSGDGEFDGVIHINGGSLAMKHCIIEGSLSNGLVLEWENAKLTAFEGNTISDCDKYPVYIEHQTSLFGLTNGGNIFSPTNKNNVIGVKNSAWSLDNDNKNTLVRMPVPYYFLGTLRLDGAQTFTIEAGTSIVFADQNCGIYAGNKVGFKIAGTAELPVIFTNATGRALDGNWGGISVSSTSPDNVWEYATFINGGSGDGEFDGVIQIKEGSLALKHCVIQGSASNGITLEWDGAKLTAFEGNTISDCEKYAMYVEQQASIFSLENNGNNFLPTNKNNVIGLRNAGWSLDSDGNNTLIKMPVPYRFLGTLRLDGTQHFTIEAGTTIEMFSNCYLEIGNDVTFVANGTATDHIKFVGDRDEKSYWGSIRYASRKSASSIKYVDFKNGGHDEAIFFLYDESKLTMDNCSFSSTEDAGLSIENANEIPGVSITNDTYSDCDGGNVRVSHEYWKDGAEEASITSGEIFEDFAAVKARL